MRHRRDRQKATRKLLAASATVLLVVALTGCGGDGSDDTSDEAQITNVVEQWAPAWAKGEEDVYCPLESSKYESICKRFSGGKPSVYQTGYLNATVESIEQQGPSKALVTLSNGCRVVTQDEGGGDWRVANSGGDLAKGCEQGTGR
jgi:hypothetical protein